MADERVPVTVDIESSVEGISNIRRLAKELTDIRKQTRKQLPDFSAQLRKGLTETARIARRGATVAAGLASAWVAAGAAIVASNRETIDELGKTADKLGVTTEALDGLRFAAELTGVEQRNLDTALQRMTRRLAEVAATGKGQAAPALEALGLSIEELAGLSADEAFRRIADAFQGVESQAERVRLAFALFDTEGVALVNTLQGGAAALDEYQKEAEELGLTLSRIEVARVEAANDAMTRFGAVIRAAGRRLTVELAPFIENVTDLIVAMIKEAGGLGPIMQRAVNASIRALGALADSIQVIRRLWADFRNLLARGFSRFLTNLGAFARVLGLDVAQSLTNLGESFRQVAITAAEAGERIRREAVPSEVLETWVTGARTVRREWQETGDVIGFEVTPQIEEATEKTTKFTKEQLALARQLGNYWRDRESARALAELGPDIEEVEKSAESLASTIQQDVAGAFTSMLTDFGDATKSAQDIFRSFASTVLSSIQRILAQQLTERLFSGFGGGGGGSGGGGLFGGSGGQGGGFLGFLKGLIPGFSEGGAVSGPGTATSDSVPARLSAGEYVVRAAAVRSIGTSVLDGINRMSSPGLASPLRFASGGEVPAVAAAPAAAPGVRVVNVLDASVAEDYLTSSAGERTVLNIIQRNRGSVRASLA